jgi:adenosylcobinamide-phosphate synthase
MDSMVGYKTPEYLRFGWCGARLDDVMNFIPARLTWLLIAAVAATVPGCSGPKAFRVGLAQHARLPGPNSGWSEAAAAGALARRLVGPIWLNGRMVTDTWIGDPSDPPLATESDLRRALVLMTGAGIAAAIAACAILAVNGLR